MSGGPKIPPAPGVTAKLPSVGLQQQPTRTEKTPAKQTNDPGRVDRAAALTQRNRADTRHLARGLASIPGRVSSPSVVGDIHDLGSAIEEATLVSKVRMRDNAKVGPTRVRPGTTAEARVAIKNGEVDYKNTTIRFMDANGKPTDLDGPFIWDADKVYIDSNGHIRADVPCFPDPNITKTVLGPEHDKVPKDPGAFMAALGKRANMPEIPLIPGTTTTVAGTEKVGSGPRAATVGATESQKKSEGQLSDAFDMGSLTFALEGLEPGTSAKLKPGPLRLGDGTILNLDQGAEVHIPENRLGKMQVELNAPIKSLQMEANGTVVRTGGGRIKLDIDFSPTTGSMPAGSKPVRVHIRELDVAGMDVETPAGVGRHHLRVRDRIAITGKNGEEPVLSYASGPDGPAINLQLPKVALSGVTGEMELQGTDGKPARFTLGDDGTGGPPRPLSVEASITVDSTSKTFIFDSHVADSAATLTPIALIDTDGFDLNLAKSTITGGGQIKVTSVGGKHQMAMHADPGNPFTVSAAIADAKLGAQDKGANLHVDLAAGTQGHLSLDTLVIGSDGTPIIEGHADPEHGVASFDVELDELNLALPGGHNLNLAEGTSGKLVVNQLDWAQNDKSPVVDAYLRIDLQPPGEDKGANALLRPGKVPGLAGATVKIDAKTGRSYIELKATIDKNGHVDCPIDIRIRDFEFQTQLEKGGLAPLSAQSVPAAPLERRAPIKLESITALAPPAAPAVPTADSKPARDILPPEMPTINIPTAKLFGAIDDTVIEVTIQPDELDSLVLPVGDNTFTFKRPKGPITARFTLEDGKVVPGKSKITFDPPLEISVVIAGPTPNPDLTIRGGVLKKDGDRATLDLDLDYDHAGVRALSIATLGWAGGKLESTVEGEVCKLVTGSASLPLDGENLVEEISKQAGLPTAIEVGGKSEATAAASPAAPAATANAATRMTARKPNVDGSHPMGDNGSYDRLIEQMESRFRYWGSRGRGMNSAEGQRDMEALADSFGQQLRREVVAQGGQQALTRLQNDRHLQEKVGALIAAANDRDSRDGTIRADNRDDVASWITKQLGAKSPNQHLLDAFNLDQATFAVNNATFTADRIPLGGDQAIEIKPGSKLTITGTPDDFTISGDAVFGNINIGNADLAAKLQSGKGNLSVRVKRGKDGSPRVTIDVKELNATEMSVSGRIGAGTSTLDEAAVDAGWIHVALGGGEPDEFRVALTGVKGNLAGAGAASHQGGRGAVESMKGTVRGDIVWENGTLSGTLEHIDMKVDGMSFGTSNSGDTRASLHVRGAATFLTDETGRIVIGRNGDKSFLTDAEVTTADGSRFSIRNGEADELTIDIGLPPNVLVSNMRGAFACTTPLARDADGKPTSVLDIRRADMRGTVRFGRDGLSTVGKMAMDNVDASVGNLIINPTGQSLLDLEQIDFYGRGFLDKTPEGAWLITSDTFHDEISGEERSALNTRAVARDIKFATDSPEITLDLADRAQAEIELFALSIGGGKSASIHLGKGKFSGVVETGDVVVGGEDSVLNRIDFKPGSLVEIDVNHLMTGTYSSGNAMATDVTIRVEGDFGDEASPVEEYGVQLERMSFEGDFRMILRALTDGKGNFSARSHTMVNADAKMKVTADLDPAASYERAKQSLRDKAAALVAGKDEE